MPVFHLAGIPNQWDDESQMWWFGGYVDGKVGPVNLNFDFVWDPWDGLSKEYDVRK